VWWDWLCGTDKPYTTAEAKRKAAIAAAKSNHKNPKFVASKEE
jgi:hypothetical protein